MSIGPRRAAFCPKAIGAGCLCFAVGRSRAQHAASVFAQTAYRWAPASNFAPVSWGGTGDSGIRTLALGLGAEIAAASCGAIPALRALGGVGVCEGRPEAGDDPNRSPRKTMQRLV
jgi:hypothetical protein